MLRRDMTTDGTAPAVALAPLLTRFRDQLGWISLLAFAASAWLSTTVAHICLALLAAMTLAQGPATWRRLSRDPFVRLCGLFLIYLTASAAWAAHQRPESAADQWNALWPWASLWLFFVVGWWLEGNWRRVAVVLTVAPLGLILSVARRTDWQ
ncbi:MAG: hypothetical protein FJ189_06200, partial [Gammaproteobacteria bacterium]|nr:hypothetical protein [Gammaproteobacteria bacterium]